MSAKKLLTKEIAEHYLEDKNSVSLGDFTEIEDAAALVLRDKEDFQMGFS